MSLLQSDSIQDKPEQARDCQSRLGDDGELAYLVVASAGFLLSLVLSCWLLLPWAQIVAGVTAVVALVGLLTEDAPQIPHSRFLLGFSLVGCVTVLVVWAVIWFFGPFDLG